MPSDQLWTVKVTSRVQGPEPVTEPTDATLPRLLQPWSSASSSERLAPAWPESMSSRALSAKRACFDCCDFEIIANGIRTGCVISNWSVCASLISIEVGVRRFDVLPEVLYVSPP